MYKCLVWGTGIKFQMNIPLLKFFEMSGLICVCGITSNENIYESIVGYKFIDKKMLVNHVSSFDRIVVMADGDVLKAIVREAIKIGFQDEIIIPYKVMGLIGFDFELYKELRKNTPTIFSCNCWGGITYNSLGLEFESPFINMFLEPKDYIRFLHKPRFYIEQELKLEYSARNNDLNIDYPVVSIEDITLHFNHYSSFDEARKKWMRRKERINWKNLFVMMYDQNSMYIDEFEDLPYEKKVFFSGNGKNNKSTISVNYNCGDGEFYNFVNRCAKGEITLYNVFKMLHEGKILTESIMKEVW